MDADGDGILTVRELCTYHGLDPERCTEALSAMRRMDDEQTLQALQREYELNEVRVKEEQRQRAHANRLRALAELAAAASDDEDGDGRVASTPTTAMASKASLTMADILRESKRRGDLASRFYET